MSTNTESPDGADWTASPLAAAYDDPQAQNELTVYPPEASETTTCWLTIDTGSVVPLADAR